MSIARANAERASFAAFLRGINVGGHKPIRMEDLRSSFESIGLENVRTLLASGNVLFDAPRANGRALGETIEAQLKKTFGHDIGVIIRTSQELRRLVDADPFGGVEVTPETRLYVTLLSERPKASDKLQRQRPDKGFNIVHILDRDVCSVLIRSPGNATTNLMGALEKQFGRRVTTRNWNTITRIVRASE